MKCECRRALRVLSVIAEAAAVLLLACVFSFLGAPSWAALFMALLLACLRPGRG